MTNGRAAVFANEFTAPGGATCAHGHGGAEGIYPKEIP